MSNDEYWFIIITLSLLLIIYYLCNFLKKRQLKSKDEEIRRLKWEIDIQSKNKDKEIKALKWENENQLKAKDKEIEALKQEAIIHSEIMSEADNKISEGQEQIKKIINENREKIRLLNKEKELEIEQLKKEYELLKISYNQCQISQLNVKEKIQSTYDELVERHRRTFRFVASLMADYLTYGILQSEIFLEDSAKYHERQRAVKIREIREETEQIIIPLKEAQYQLDYLLQLYPELNEVINYREDFLPPLDEIKKNKEIYNDDPVSSYISREEWDNLSPAERNQLALDRYISRNKSNWEIGRDYELYVAYRFEKRGYKVDTFGSYMKLNDLGRDLIAKKDKKIKVVQCKYWSSQKVIHENHICQLFGTVICYCIENNLKTSDVEPVFITSTILSEQAKKFADMLKITVLENFPLKEFPRIKCNIGRDEHGKTYIYHLPMDQLYDKVQISQNEECYCTTVAEAEALGFRRAYKWHGN